MKTVITFDKRTNHIERFNELINLWNELEFTEIKEAENRAKYISQEAKNILKCDPSSFIGMEVCVKQYPFHVSFPTNVVVPSVDRHIEVSAGFNFSTE